MDIVGLKVVHKKFGEGVIKELQGQVEEASDRAYVRVAFKKSVREFSYPKAFVRFLTMVDEEAQAYVQTQIEERREQIAEAEAAAPPRPTVREMVHSLRPRRRKADSNVAFRAAFEEGQEAPWTDDNMWRARAGLRTNGQPVTMARAQSGSLCVLTTKLPDQEESQRFINGVFIIDEAYPGNQGRFEGEDEAGWVSAHRDYRLALPQKVAKNFLYWNYQANMRQAHLAKWGSGLFRYLSDTVAVQILKDLSNAKLSAKQLETVNNMLAHYTEVNRIDPHDVAPPQGALTREQEDDVVS